MTRDNPGAMGAGMTIITTEAGEGYDAGRYQDPDHEKILGDDIMRQKAAKAKR